MRKNQDEQNYDGMVFGLDGQGFPELYLVDFRTGGPKNGSGMTDAEVDADVNKTLAIVNEKERQEATKAFLDKYLQKVMYRTTFADKINYGAWTKDVHNWISAPAGGLDGGFAFTWLGNA